MEGEVVRVARVAMADAEEAQDMEVMVARVVRVAMVSTKDMVDAEELEEASSVEVSLEEKDANLEDLEVSVVDASAQPPFYPPWSCQRFQRFLPVEAVQTAAADLYYPNIPFSIKLKPHSLYSLRSKSAKLCVYPGQMNVSRAKNGR